MRAKQILLTFLFLALTSLAGFASGGKCGQNLTWTLDKSGNLVISGTGPMKDFGSGDTPWRSEMVRTIQLNEGITSIGRNAFAKSKINIIVIPAGVESIGTNAFKGCRSLASVTIPYGVTTIGKSAFEDCVSLPKVLMPSSVRVIGENAFEGCRYMTEASIPGRVQSIGANAFKDCYLDRLIELPDFITTSNSSLYGLSRAVVSDYYSRVPEVKQETVAVAAPEPKTSRPADKKSDKKTTVKYGSSDVDRPITPRPQNNSNTFAFIFANENYKSFSDVPFAQNDGNSFAKYCTAILGIPERNVNMYHDATAGVMRGAIDYLKDIDDAFNGDMDVIVYYAGHGAPTDDTKDPYLIPVDATMVSERVCYPLSEFYKDLSGLKAKSVTVFLDACFSGPGRDNAMLESARKVAVVPKENTLGGNLVVFSAASDDQTAWQLEDQGHGLFTYYLLKKLRETNGDVTLGELSEYINSNVLRTSVVVNQKRQSPATAVSPRLGQKWRTHTLR